MRNGGNGVTEETSRDANCCRAEVGELVQRLVRAFQLFERDHIRVLGFTSTQGYALLEVSERPGVTMNELSERMNVEGSTMTRVVDLLVRDGWLVRRREDDDRRVVRVFLAEKAGEAVSRLRDNLDAYYGNIVKNLPEGRVEEVLAVSELLLSALKRSNPKCC